MLTFSQDHLSKGATEGSPSSFSYREKKSSSWSRDVDIFTKSSIKRDNRGISFKLFIEREGK
jgi:hypothetical protein